MAELATFIIIRTEPGATETSERLTALGHRAVVSPVLAVEADDAVDLSPAEHASILIFTSANGVRIFAARSADRDAIAVCVGPSTYLAAEQAGFTTRYNADGDSDAVLNLVQSTFAPEDHRICHIANHAAAGELAQGLRDAGYETVFLAPYRTIEIPHLSSEAEDILSAPAATKTAVLVHSAKAATAFARTVEQSQKQHALFDKTAIAISPRARVPLNNLPFSKILEADHPNEEALFRQIDVFLKS